MVRISWSSIVRIGRFEHSKLEKKVFLNTGLQSQMTLTTICCPKWYLSKCCASCCSINQFRANSRKLKRGFVHLGVSDLRFILIALHQSMYLTSVKLINGLLCALFCGIASKLRQPFQLLPQWLWAFAGDLEGITCTTVVNSTQDTSKVNCIIMWRLWRSTFDVKNRPKRPKSISSNDVCTWYDWPSIGAILGAVQVCDLHLHKALKTRTDRYIDLRFKLAHLDETEFQSRGISPIQGNQWLSFLFKSICAGSQCWRLQGLRST